MQRGKFNIIIGAQAGSEAKGKFSAFLCSQSPPDALVMASSPNAGHTAYLPNGEKRVSYHLPIGAVACNAPIYLGPASLINPKTFAQEIVDLGIDPRRIHIDPRASIITEGYIWCEASGGLSDIGSTLQGVGETRCRKMRREVGHPLVIDCIEPFLADVGNVTVQPTSFEINSLMDEGATVLCEMTQGFDLDLEHGIDPRYCTSKMINPAMAMAEAGVSPKRVGTVYGVLRPYPIRVNNRTGTSGPYGHSAELRWREVAERCGHPNPDELMEITTTTKLPRRVFEFCHHRLSHFIQVCQPDVLCLQFANYIDWDVYGVESMSGLTPRVVDWIHRLVHRYNVPVKYVGTGPEYDAMVMHPGGGDLW